MSKVRPLVLAYVGVADGPAVRVDPGHEWDADDPFVKDHPHLFGEPVEPVVRRTIGRPRKHTEDEGK